MATWNDIQKHMRGRYKLADDQPDMMSMVWTYEEGRHQKIIVRRFEAAGQDMVEFKSAFARKGQVEPEVLLRDNAQLPLATAALSGDVYLVVYNALIRTLDDASFEFILARVAAVADTLEEKYGSSDAF